MQRTQSDAKGEELLCEALRPLRLEAAFGGRAVKKIRLLQRKDTKDAK